MERLGRLLRELRPLAPLNWSPLENVHITTKFIGAWPEERLEELTHALAEIKPPAAFPVTIAGFVHKPGCCLQECMQGRNSPRWRVRWKSVWSRLAWLVSNARICHT